MNIKPPLSQTKILPISTRFSDTNTRTISATLSSKPAYFAELKATKETTRIEPSNAKKDWSNEDSFFAKIAIDYLSKTLQNTAGLCSDTITSKGYDNLVDTATRVASNLDTKQQHEFVLVSLNRAFPTLLLSFIKMVLPPSKKLSRELFALFTTIFFTWLVGPSEVKETEVNGSKEKSLVFIKKCRFLEKTNCVGMCTNLCKIPSQTFIKKSLGMPIYMMPDFDDLSCKMMFGQEPPEIKDDPVMKQPCFKLCKSNKNYGLKH